jgi:hypothetical protein
MAGTAFTRATEAFRVLPDPATRRTLEVAYFDRLLRSELGPQVSGAVRGGDPEIVVLFGALVGFLRDMPRDVVGSSGYAARSLLEPPLLRWHRLPRSGRTAYRGLLDVVRDLDPAFAHKASGPLAGIALGAAIRLPAAVGDPLAAALVMLSRVPAAARRRFRPATDHVRAPAGPPR